MKIIQLKTRQGQLIKLKDTKTDEKRLVSSPPMPDEYLRMQVVELGRRIEELKKEQTQAIRIFDDLRKEVIEYKKRNEAFKKDEDNDFITYGKTVWTKSTGEGPFVTINRVALEVDTDKGYSRTVMGWICKTSDGKYVELAEEDLSKKFQTNGAEIDSDWPVLILILATFLAPVFLFPIIMLLGHLL